MTTTHARPVRGPVRASERALAPDLARGLMLLLIVTSNTMFFLWRAEYAAAGQHPTPTSATDAIAQFAMTVGLDMRIYPLFAFLFGYGMVQLFRRQVAAGSSELAVIRLLRRRSAWLLLLGFIHAALLLASDVLGAYGLISLVLGAFFLRRADRKLRVWSVVGAVLLLGQLLVSVLTLLALQAGVIPADVAAGGSGTAAELSNPAASGAGSVDYLAAAVSRLTMWTGITGITVFGITAPLAMLLGIQAARHRLLEEPREHVRLLRRTAVVGLAIGWLGGLPAALAHLDVITFGEIGGLREQALLGVQWPTGLAGGVGYVALFALLAHRLDSRPRGWLLTGATAVGRNSLSCYLAHSIVLGPVLAAWGLGLGARLTSTTAMAYAAVAWLATLAGATWLDRTGRRGPAETLLRRLVYGQRT